MRRRTAPIHEAFQSNYIAPVGPMVDAFEQEFAERVGICFAFILSDRIDRIIWILLLVSQLPDEGEKTQSAGKTKNILIIP